jgi:hypothetical protein
MTTKKRKDPFNQPMGGYKKFINDLYTAVNANALAWGIDPLVIAAFLALLTVFNTAYAISSVKTTATSPSRAATRGSRGIVNKFARTFVQKWIYLNDNMTDADIIACGLEPRDKTRTPIGAPESVPNMILRPMTSHNIKGRFIHASGDNGSKKQNKPDGVKSVKVAVFVGKIVPAEPDDYGRFMDSTRVDVVIPFNAALKGQDVTIAACWVNEKEEQGDWCEPVTMVIP